MTWNKTFEGLSVKIYDLFSIWNREEDDDKIWYDLGPDPTLGERN